ncbi:MAG: TonB family protein [Fibrobacteres bacterium]|nr:TonB family protein [Fibrobacterota bacterium]
MRFPNAFVVGFLLAFPLAFAGKASASGLATALAADTGESVYQADPMDRTRTADSLSGETKDSARTADGDSARNHAGDSARVPIHAGLGGPGPGSAGTASADSALELMEKNVKARGTRIHREKEVSRIRLNRRDIQRVAAAQGDPLKVLSTLPGVTNQNDLSVRPFVRGGKAEETQILWDGVPLLQPYHFGTIYSIFNTESLESMTLYSGGFPVEAGNALSAALLMQARPAPLDSLRLFADLSFLRGNTYVGIPIVKNKLGVSLSYQAFWYDWVVNRVWDMADLVQSDSAFTAQKEDFRRYLELPNFRDAQFGVNWLATDKLRADYAGLISRDGFHSRNPGTRYYQNGREVSEQWFRDNNPDTIGNKWTQRQTLDTIANVAVDNQVHGIHLHWRPTGAWDVDQNVAYQRQDWHVKFSDEATWHDSVGPGGRYAGYKTFGPSVRYMRLGKQAIDWNLNSKWQAAEDHLIKMGLFQSYRTFDFKTKMEKSIYGIIVEGSVDLTDGLSYLDPNGTVIREGDFGANPDANYLMDLPDLIRFDFDGRNSGAFVGGYLSDVWNLDGDHRLTTGFRYEVDTWSGDAFLSPRAAYFQGLGDKDEITLASGLYSQSDFAFNLRDVNPDLKPEKAFHVNAEWTHHFSKSYRLETQLYQKNYYDLAVPILRNTGHIDFGKGNLQGIDSAGFKNLDPVLQRILIERFGEKDLDYTNQGIGKAGGGEVSFFYDPWKSWSGWVSGEVSYSKRRDLPGERVYDFRYHRPWAFNWVNYFHMPSNYELSLRGRFAAGLPYTNFSTPLLPGSTLGKDTLFYLEPRNSSRYVPYSRWDIRLSKEFPVFKHQMSSYMEIWNAFNTPNFIMQDQKTRNWKFFDANYPIPILFMGLSYRW